MQTLKNIWNGQKFLIGVIVGLLIGVSIGFATFNRGLIKTLSTSSSKEEIKVGDVSSEESPGAKDTNSSHAESIEVSGQNAVAVLDQPAGNMVIVTMATLSRPGWVVVQEEGVAGMPGRVLGAHRYDSGIHLAEVELLKSTEAGKTYYVGLYVDDGDRAFSLENDAPIKGSDGKIIEDSFKAE